jgi:hypothetical protein
MHLPRIAADCCDTTPAAVRRFESIDVPHQIVFAPVQVLREHGGTLARALRGAHLGAVFCSDELLAEVQETSLAGESLHGVIGFSELVEARIQDLWHATAREVGAAGIRSLGLPLTPLDGLAPERLSLLFLAIKFGPCDRRIDAHLDLDRKQIISERMGLARYSHALAVAEDTEVPLEELDGWLKTELSSSRHRARFHLAVVAPGVAPEIARMRERAPATARVGAVASIEDERRALSLLAAHRAVARGGFGLHLPDVPRRAFVLLRELERALSANSIRPRKIAQQLKQLGDLLDDQLDENQRSAIRSSSSITVFSDFPWGLAMLRGDSSPICTAVPMAYRSLSPLSQCLQLELIPPQPRYLGSGFSVIVAECLSDADPVRRISEVAWRLQIDLLRRQTIGAIECRYEVVKSVDQLRALLRRDRADILVISAHGVYERFGKVAGIEMESGPVLELDVELPPVVLFSACHVAPRGAGAVSVADLAFRFGAIAVLGTLFPVRADHNAMLMTRLFTYICESLQRRGELCDLSEIASHVLSTNAVIDVVYGCKRARQWAHRPGPNGRPAPLTEFMLDRSQGRLLPGQTYAQTELVLLEIARDHGLSTESWLRQYLNSTGYVPESLFYVLLGRPEQVIVQPQPGFERAYV